MSNYDVILHFEWIHNSHVHKYLALNKKLNKQCKSLMVFDNSQFGISKDFFSNFKKDDCVNVLLISPNEAKNLLSKFNYKIYIGSSCGQKGHRDAVDIANKKAVTIQISDQMGDAYCCKNFRIYSLINNIMSDVCNYNNKIIWYSNCLLWDDIEECLPYNLTRNEFCSKYFLNPDKDILIWMPDNIQCQKGQAIVVYEQICKIDNVIIKLHPNEHKRHKSEIVNGKWSYELYTNRKVPVLNPIDTHWAFRYASCGFGYTSTIGLEFSLCGKPFVYIDQSNNKNNLPIAYTFTDDINKKNFGGKFSWVGGDCDSSDLNCFIEEKKYVVLDNNLYNKHKDLFLAYPNKKSIDVLSEQIINLLNNVKK